MVIYIWGRNVADLQRNGSTKETAEFARLLPGKQRRLICLMLYIQNGSPNTTKVTPEQYCGNNGKFVAAEGFIYETTWFRVREARLVTVCPVHC